MFSTQPFLNPMTETFHDSLCLETTFAVLCCGDNFFYFVILYYLKSGEELRIAVYDWNGSWSTFNIYLFARGCKDRHLLGQNTRKTITSENFEQN